MVVSDETITVDIGGNHRRIAHPMLDPLWRLFDKVQIDWLRQILTLCWKRRQRPMQVHFEGNPYRHCEAWGGLFVEEREYGGCLSRR